MASDKPIIAIATGDPAGIGPEISLKAALDPMVRAACRPILVSDAAILNRHADACGIRVDLHPVRHIGDAGEAGYQLAVLDCPQKDGIAIGKTTLVGGDPGLGKSQLSIFIAATISQAGAWPCKEGSPPKRT